jgi:hypothetical protein
MKLGITQFGKKELLKERLMHFPFPEVHPFVELPHGFPFFNFFKFDFLSLIFPNSRGVIIFKI